MQRILHKAPSQRYIDSVREGTKQQKETAAIYSDAAMFHSQRVLFYAKRNHFTPLVVQLIRGG